MYELFTANKKTEKMLLILRRGKILKKKLRK